MTKQKSEAECFSSEVELLRPKLLAYARRLKESLLKWRSDLEPEDLVQEALTRGFESISTFDGRSSLMTWLQRIMIHVSLEPLKRKESKYDYDRTDEAVSNISVHSVLDDPHRAFCAHMRSDLLLDAIRQMTPEERTAFFATEKEMIGLTYEQAAEQLNWTIETVKSRVSSARRRVRTSIPKEWVP